MTYLFFKTVVKLYKKHIDDLAEERHKIESSVYSSGHKDAMDEVNFILNKNAMLTRNDEQRLKILEGFFAETMEYYERFLEEEKKINKREERFGKKLSEIIFAYERDADMAQTKLSDTQARIENATKKKSLSITERIKNRIINFLRK
jgi:hypothetical protein